MDPRLQMTSGGLSGSVSPFLGSVFLQVGFCFREAPFQGAFLGSSKLLLCFPVTSHRSEGTSSLNASQVPGLSLTGILKEADGTVLSGHHVNVNLSRSSGASKKYDVVNNTVNVSDLSAGVYTVMVYLDSDDNYLNSFNSSMFVVLSSAPFF